MILVSVGRKVSVVAAGLPTSFLPTGFRILDKDTLGLVTVALVLVSRANLVVLCGCPTAATALFDFNNISCD